MGYCRTPSKPVPISTNTPLSSATPAISSSLFGNAAICSPANLKNGTSSLFGNKPVFGGTPAGQSPVTNLFGGAAASQSPATNLFGKAAASQSPATNLFGGAAASQSPATNLFGKAAAGQSSATNLFGGAAASQSPAKNLFGAAASQSPAKSVFGGAVVSQSPAPSAFGDASQSPSSNSSPKALFAMFAKKGNEQSTDAPSNNNANGDSNKSKIPVFGGKSTPAQAAEQPVKDQTSTSTPGKSMIPMLSNKFTSGQSPLIAQPKLAQTSATSLFGGAANKPSTPSGSLFGSPNTDSNALPASSLFGAKPTPQALFGGAGAKNSVFGGSKPVVTSSADSSDVEFVCESKPSDELMRKAKDFLLPAGYYMYEERKPCKGCIGNVPLSCFCFHLMLCISI